MLKRFTQAIRRQDWFAVTVEILVVMIGLLLAFQLDRWRETRLDREQERAYLDRLIADVTSDVPAIERAIGLGRIRQGLAELLMRVSGDPQAALETPTLFMAAVNQAAFTYTPELTAHTFENLLATGDLRLIRDEALQKSLFEYYGFDRSQRQFRPLEFATEHHHFELAAGVLSLEQAAYFQDRWLFLRADNLEAARADRPHIGGIVEAAQRLASRPQLVAWLPHLRSLQLEQIQTHEMRLARARDLVDVLTRYADSIREDP